MAEVKWQAIGPRKHRVLVHVGPWDEAIPGLYGEAGCTGLHWSMKPRQRGHRVSVEPLLDLDGLAYLWLQVPAEDGAVIGQLADLEVLDLLTRSSSPLDLSELKDLWRAGIDDRPGLSGWPDSVEELALALSDRQHLRWLQAVPRLKSLLVEGRGQRVSLDGTPPLPQLRSLRLENVLVDVGAEPLLLPRVEVVHLVADQLGGTTVDAAAFEQCAGLKWLTIRGPTRVTNLAALRRLPSLEQVTVIAPSTPEEDGVPQLRFVEWHGGKGR